MNFGLLLSALQLPLASSPFFIRPPGPNGLHGATAIACQLPVFHFSKKQIGTNVTHFFGMELEKKGPASSYLEYNEAYGLLHDASSTVQRMVTWLTAHCTLQVLDSVALEQSPVNCQCPMWSSWPNDLCVGLPATACQLAVLHSAPGAE